MCLQCMAMAAEMAVAVEDTIALVVIVARLGGHGGGHSCWKK
jgi:hypothetical protein